MSSLKPPLNTSAAPSESQAIGHSSAPSPTTDQDRTFDDTADIRDDDTKLDVPAHTKSSIAPDDEKGALAEELTPVPSTILTGMNLFLAFVGMLLAVFLIALDQTILSPALPVIASQFNSLEQIGWIASAYYITQVGFLLLYGQVLTCFNRRWVFIMAVVIFEVGSLICGIAPSVNVLIFGRAVAGVGAGGIFTSVLSIIADVTRLEDRPKLMGSFGGVFAASSILGPLMGGAFTDHVSWRWCFYINLPVGAITIASILFVIPNTPPPPVSPSLIKMVEDKYRRWTRGRVNPQVNSFLWKLGLLDFVGAFMMVGIIVVLVMALQWGGTEYPWSDKHVWGCFIAFGLLLVSFILWEWKAVGETSLLPFRLFKNRTQVGTCLTAFFMMFSMLVAIYYEPIWYQAVRHATATKSGIDILPLMLAVVFTAATCGFIISTFGRYWPCIVVGPIFSAVGFGLMYTIGQSSGNGKLIGYQIIVGVGIGAVLQNTIIAVQATVSPRDVPQATSLVTFCQLIGGTLGLALAQTVFGTALATNLHKYAPNAPFDAVRYSVEAIYTIAEDLRPGVIHSYALAIRNVYIVGVPSSGLAFIAAFLIKNKNIKGHDVGAAAAV